VGAGRIVHAPLARPALRRPRLLLLRRIGARPGAGALRRVDDGEHPRLHGRRGEPARRPRATPVGARLPPPPLPHGAPRHFLTAPPTCCSAYFCHSSLIILKMSLPVTPKISSDFLRHCWTKVFGVAA